MEDPPDREPADDAPTWAFYSLWPRVPEPARAAPERWRDVDPPATGTPHEAAMG